MKQVRHLRSDKERDTFVNGISSYDFVQSPMTFTFEPYKENKNREQEKKYHAMIRDISKAVLFAGEYRDIDFWKIILMSAFRKEQGINVQVYAGLKGEAVVMGLSTRKLKLTEASDFIEFIYSEFPDTEWSENN